MNGRTIRKRLRIDGLIQGVGFRPFVASLAQQSDISGWAANSPNGMVLELESEEEKMQLFVSRLKEQAPPLARIESVEVQEIPPEGQTRFELRSSLLKGRQSVFVAPDIATCTECLDECFDPSCRRYRYPFISCSRCGPRFSIVTSLPYDRMRTSMNEFQLCKSCLAEYEDPSDRRYHAQTNACEVCGPEVKLLDTKGTAVACRDAAIIKAVEVLREGGIVAIKGIGGFQFLVNAQDQAAVMCLRERKQRPDKPFALMCRDIGMVGRICEVSVAERVAVLCSAAPIVLLRKKELDSGLAASVAPGNLNLGVMLAYSPLHHIILRDFAAPVVATSGNLSGEPICVEQCAAQEKLCEIADFFLVHNRTIQRPLDDSIVSIVAGEVSLLRRARGYAPLPIKINQSIPHTLAVGGHLKSTIAVARDNYVVLSQHLGDLETQAAVTGFSEAITDLKALYKITPGIIARDWHPDYHSSRYSVSDPGIIVGVQHHYAHVLACMAEHGLDTPVLGVAWDGFGFGGGNSLWGGEFLCIRERGFERLASLRSFQLPGGASAAKEPRRSALAVLYEVFGEDTFSMSELAPLLAFRTGELPILNTALKKRINSLTTSSMGRLFDAIASLLGLCQISSFEAQAAISLEQMVYDSDDDASYPFDIVQSDAENLIRVDWEPMLRMILQDCRSGTKHADIARKFHNTLVEMIVKIVHRAGIPKVALSGGTFQNRYLLEQCIQRLRAEGYSPYWPQRIPTNDGGLALGQIMGAFRDQKTCV